LWPAESIVQAAALFKFQTEVAFFFQGAVIFVGSVRAFSGAGHPLTRPCKCISRGGSG